MRSNFANWFLGPLGSAPKLSDLFWRLLAGFITVDLLFLSAFVAMSLFNLVGVGQSLQWLVAVDADHSPPEVMQYLKWTICLVSTLLAWRKQQDWALFACSVIFAGFLYDDLNTVHERAGFILTDTLKLTLTFGVKANLIGQLLAFGVLAGGAILVAVIGSGLGRKWGRQILIRFAVLFAMLIVFGVGVDAIDEAVSVRLNNPAFSPVILLLVVIEDGGEMMVASLCAAFAVAVAGLPARRN